MKKTLLVVALLALGASGALAQDVSYNFAKDAKFSDYKTYKWVDLKGADEPNQITQNQIKAAIDSQLATKESPRPIRTTLICTLQCRRPWKLRNSSPASHQAGAMPGLGRWLV